MTEQQYKIRMHTPIGDREGTLYAQISGRTITGYLNLLNHTELFGGVIDSLGNCRISGKLVTLIKAVPFTASGEILPKKLRLSLTADQNRHFQITGFPAEETEDAV